MTMHDDEIGIRDETVRRLVDEQFPDLADTPIERLASSGTVNVIFRIGDDLAARFPRRRRRSGGERHALESEARACGEFSRVSPFPSPEPVAVGDPGEGFPLSWSLQTWLPGTVADGDATADRASLALDLAALVQALRAVDTGGLLFDRGTRSRGGDLADHDPWMRTCLERSRGLLDVPRLTAVWDRFVGLPRGDADVMSHGDLIPGNLLVTDGRLVGVLDCGGFGPADPALDCIVAWHLLDDERRRLFRDALGVDDPTWERSKAWAFEQSMGAVWYYERTNPAMSAMGRRTLARIVADTPTGL